MVAKPNFKKNKFEERVLHLLNSFLREQIADPRLKSVSVTRVEANPDYSVVVAFWDTYDSGTRGDAKRAIEKVRGKMRSLLAQSLEARVTPQVSFKYDSQYEAEKIITDLLEKPEDGEEA